MQWGQVKTLFILCFLVLDIFLIQQFNNNREVELPSIPQESSKEETLKADIEGLDDLPEEIDQESNLYASRKTYTEDEIESINGLNDQQVAVIDGNLILSQFEEPIPINMDGNYAETLQSSVLFSDNFVFWGKNEPSNTLIFFQKNNDRPIYFNQGGLLLIVLDEEGRMVQYSQTMLEEEEEERERETYDLIEAIDAVSSLYYNTSELSSGEKVTGSLGYHNLIPLPNGVQVLAPTWRITVNSQRNYFVNAIEMHTYFRDDNDFLIETINDTLGKIGNLDNESELLKEIVSNYTEIIETTIWSGEE
ncbi:two-component system regulatory protein YycI [Aquibacillus saliphilus]|uniref:two-component system regulatory protein YycI n=1 Tax=Aquibacillus saliphilus TaxID=1909422 RepID=UPI001CF0B379|nr:two-component system regulatory protein YycI [Aquibacillus saliphilus]